MRLVEVQSPDISSSVVISRQSFESKLVAALGLIVEGGKNGDGERITLRELAKAVGISYTTLHRYIKRGCPKSSAEDIRQWIKNHRAGRLVELAKAVGISYQTLRKYINMGCPKSSAEDIRQWIKNHRAGRLVELAKAVGIPLPTLHRYIKRGCPKSSAEDVRQWIKNHRAGRVIELAKDVGRVMELAKAVGISQPTLRKFIKMGCPKSSVEDIRQWIKNHRAGRLVELARAVGISYYTLKKYFKMGCPKSSAEDIRQWIDDHPTFSRKRRTLRELGLRSSLADLARDVGISYHTLKKYFEMGCPTSSVEDIKQWIKNHRAGRVMELAKAVGISHTTLKKYFKMGCPTSSAEDIRQWIKNHRAGRVVELAKAVGIPLPTLKRYIKMGCPKSSVEDIRQWIDRIDVRISRDANGTVLAVSNDNRAGRLVKLAKAVGISYPTLRKYINMGCPKSSAEDIKLWIKNRELEKLKSFVDVNDML